MIKYKIDHDLHFDYDYLPNKNELYMISDSENTIVKDFDDKYNSFAFFLKQELDIWIVFIY